MASSGDATTHAQHLSLMTTLDVCLTIRFPGHDCCRSCTEHERIVTPGTLTWPLASQSHNLGMTSVSHDDARFVSRSDHVPHWPL